MRGRPSAATVEDAEFLYDADENLTGVCARLGLKPDSLYAACRRAGRPDVYEKLAAREPDAEMRAKVRAAKG